MSKNNYNHKVKLIKKKKKYMMYCNYCDKVFEEIIINDKRFKQCCINCHTVLTKIRTDKIKESMRK